MALCHLQPPNHFKIRPHNVAEMYPAYLYTTSRPDTLPYCSLHGFYLEAKVGTASGALLAEALYLYLVRSNLVGGVEG